MKKMIKPAHESMILQVTLSGTVAAGAMVLYENTVGFHQNGGVSGDLDTVHFEGLQEVKKQTGETWAVGEPVYADIAAQDVTKTQDAAAERLIGIAAATAASGDTTGQVLLLPNRNFKGSHIADPSGGGTVDAEARTAINAILVVLETNNLTALS